MVSETVVAAFLKQCSRRINKIVSLDETTGEKLRMVVTIVLFLTGLTGGNLHTEGGDTSTQTHTHTHANGLETTCSLLICAGGCTSSMHQVSWTRLTTTVVEAQQHYACLL